MIIDAYRFGSNFPTPSSFFSSDPMLSSGWEAVTYPAGYQYSDATYVAWQFVGLAGNKGVHVAAYDHYLNAWSDRYTLGNFLLADDDHGHPALIRDASGYIHCFYGSHNNPQKYSVSNAPDDISAWTQRPDIFSALTYPKPVLVGSTIYLFARDSTTSTNLKMVLATMTPTAGIGTFSALQILIDFGSSSRVYASEPHLRGTEIHWTAAYAPIADNIRQNVYYFILDTTTGSIKNYNGTVTVSSGSLPISKATADASFRIFAHSGGNDGDIPSMQFDTLGNPHVLFADGVTPNYALKHMTLSGGVWSSPFTVANVTDMDPASGYVGTYIMSPGASGKMEAWYNVSGDKVRRVRLSSGSWITQETISTMGTYEFEQACSVRDANPNLRVLYSENAGSATDSSAALLGLYAYGDSGPINNPINMTPVDSNWQNVVMLLGCNARNGSAIFIDDSKSSFRCTVNGNSQIDTGQTPFVGRASMRLDGSGDFLSFGTNSQFSLAGTQEFTIDFWVRLNELGRLQTFFSKRPAAGTSEYSLVLSATNQIQMLMWNGSGLVLNITAPTAMTTGVWYFVEATRIGNTGYVFLNGNLEVSGALSANPTSNSASLLIGRDITNTARDFNGWLTECRFTRAGRNSASYTPPSGPFPRK